MVKILDCETQESTYKSLEIILGICETKLKSIFDEVDIDDGYYRCKQILSVVNQEAISTDFDTVCWFHLTRVPFNIRFSKGILPLAESIEIIWDFLYSLIKEDFSEEEWNEFKNIMNNGKISKEKNSCSNAHYLFQLKTKNQRHGGPFAMLVKEIAFNSKQVGNHDYLEAPEIIEDICDCFKGIYNYNLIEKYLAETKSCIVKFMTKKDRNNLLEPVLYYLYSKYKNHKLSLDCNTCFDAEGNIISQDNILSIDWIEY